MLLAVDIGNTNITLGVFQMDGGRPLRRAPRNGRGAPPEGRLARPLPRVSVSWRMSTHRDGTSDEYGVQVTDFFRHAGLEPARVQGVAVASVVPPMDGVFRVMARDFFRAEPLFVGPGMKTGVRVLYDNPAEVGADRIVNAAAAYERVKGPCIVVDFGTATTFDCVNKRGHYMGGVIAPGPAVAAESLARRTAKLPLVGNFRRPASAIGRSTQDSLASGFYYGYLGLTEGILRRLLKEMGGRPAVLATGGLASLFAPGLRLIQQTVPDLTLEGLRLIWIRNRRF